jgi:hypothetical protein
MSHYTSSARQEATPADLDFGHGFIPRIGEENYEAVDRCVGPADLFSTSLDLTWAIVDGAWAEKKPELLTTMRQHGTKLLVVTSKSLRPQVASRRSVSCSRRRFTPSRTDHRSWSP